MLPMGLSKPRLPGHKVIMLHCYLYVIFLVLQVKGSTKVGSYSDSFIHFYIGYGCT